MVADVNNDFVFGNVNSEALTDIPLRTPEDVRTTSPPDISDILADTTPRCEPRYRCHRRRRCQFCHDRYIDGLANKIRTRVDQLTNQDPADPRQIVVLRCSVSTDVTDSYPTWQLQMDRLYEVWGMLVRERSKATQRKVKSGLALLHGAIFYPHFRNERGGNHFSHWHGVAVISREFDYQQLVSFYTAHNIDIYPMTPAPLKGGWIEYMLEEFYAERRTVTIDGEERSGLGMLDKPIESYIRKCHGRLLRQTGVRRNRKLSASEMADNQRYDRLKAASKSYPQMEEAILLSQHSLRANRLARITSLARAAHAEAIQLGLNQFALSARQLARLYQVTEKVIRDDLSALVQHGLLRCVSAPMGQAKEYSLVTQYKRRNDAYADRPTECIRSGSLDSQGSTCP